MTPRDIQARIRTGATPQELADESGMPLSAIDRYAGPPLAERAWTVERAQDSVLRPGDRTLAAVVGAEAAAHGTEPDAIAWDSWRRPDGRWAVVATFDAAGSVRVTTWIYDPRFKAVVADDAEAHRLADEDVVVPMRSGRRQHTEIIPVDSAEPDIDESVAGSIAVAVDEIEVHVVEVAEVIEIGEATDAGTDESAVPSVEPVQETLDVPAPDAGRRTKRGRRASVPSWDEILFGSQQDDA